MALEACSICNRPYLQLEEAVGGWRWCRHCKDRCTGRVCRLALHRLICRLQLRVVGLQSYCYKEPSELGDLQGGILMQVIRCNLHLLV